MQLVGGTGQGEHHHLEGHHHGEHAQVVDDLAEQAAYASHIPCCHGGTQQDQRGRDNGNEQAVKYGFDKGIAAECHTLDIVLQPHESVLIGQGKGLRVYGGVALEGVYQHDQNRQNVDDADHSKYHGQHHFAAVFSGFQSVSHHCCTSFLRVDRNWIRPMAATRTKNRTALAWAVPRLLPLEE